MLNQTLTCFTSTKHMEAIKTRTLEMTVMSGENLCIERTAVTENAYVVVRAESLKCWTTKTAKQQVSSLSTVWNDKLIMEVPLHAQSITFQAQCKTPTGTVRSIGMARIAIGDVIPKGEECVEMHSYRLRNWEGKRSGVINFSVKVVKEEQEEEEKEEKETKKVTCGAFGSGVVTGIPLCWIHPGIPIFEESRCI